MTTTELTTPRPAPAAAAPPTFGEMLEETIPLIGFIPVAGPPAILLAGPWLVLVLMLVGYFALMLTVAALLVAAVALAGLIRELVAVPFRLFRDLRTHHLALRPSTARLASSQ